MMGKKGKIRKDVYNRLFVCEDHDDDDDDDDGGGGGGGGGGGDAMMHRDDGCGYVKYKDVQAEMVLRKGPFPGHFSSNSRSPKDLGHKTWGS